MHLLLSQRARGVVTSERVTLFHPQCLAAEVDRLIVASGIVRRTPQLAANRDRQWVLVQGSPDTYHGSVRVSSLQWGIPPTVRSCEGIEIDRGHHSRDGNSQVGKVGLPPAQDRMPFNVE